MGKWFENIMDNFIEPNNNKSIENKFFTFILCIVIALYRR